MKAKEMLAISGNVVENKGASCSALDTKLAFDVTLSKPNAVGRATQGHSFVAVSPRPVQSFRSPPSSHSAPSRLSFQGGAIDHGKSYSRQAAEKEPFQHSPFTIRYSQLLFAREI